MHNKQLKRVNPLNLFLLIAVFMLVGCGSGNEVTDQSENVSFAIPDTLLGNKVDRTNLSATITINGGTPQALTIDDATNSATISLSNIPTGSTTIVIQFIYNFDDNGTPTPLVVAEASQTVTISEGSNNITFVAGEYDTSFDEDGDGISNLAELDETSTTNPTVETCLIGTDSADSSTLDNCELG